MVNMAVCRRDGQICAGETGKQRVHDKLGFQSGKRDRLTLRQRTRGPHSRTSIAVEHSQCRSGWRAFDSSGSREPAPTVGGRQPSGQRKAQTSFSKQ